MVAEPAPKPEKSSVKGSAKSSVKILETLKGDPHLAIPEMPHARDRLPPAPGQLEQGAR